MIDLKNYGLRRPRDQRLDDIATGLAWFVACMLVVFYGMGATP